MVTLREHQPVYSGSSQDLETKENSMAKQAWELTTDDKVQYIVPETMTNLRKKITSVEWIPGTDVYFQVEGVAGTFAANPWQEFTFPRRENGSRMIHQHASELAIRDLCVGDLVPPERGWKKNRDGITFDLSEATQVLQVVPYKSPSMDVWLGWRLTVKTFGVTSQRMVALTDPRFYGAGSSLFRMDKPIVPEENRPIKMASNASGAYRNIHTGETATFRIAGKAGRPPLASRRVPADRSEWDNWVFVGPGERHLNEVMYRKSQTKEAGEH